MPICDLVYGFWLYIDVGEAKGPVLWSGLASLNLILSWPLTVPTTVSPTVNAADAPFPVNWALFEISMSFGTISTPLLLSKNW